MELQVMLYTMGTMCAIYLLVRHAYHRGVSDTLQWLAAATKQNTNEEEDKTND